jgi:hypothetical protein
MRTARRLEVKVTADERESIEVMAAACGLSLSEFVRRAALRQKISPVAKVPEANLAIYPALGRIGGNLNQIAAQLHAGNFSDGPRLGELMLELKMHLDETRRQLLGAGQ